ncbi:TetR/AcrR family transcriptional regulator [Tsukamurella paurometabola]|uniref:Transcriptional regulator BetI n=1 Tax=Tsukamurella paurometabola TaxID=2061 RepID=A0A3P8JVE3_TSUPA|nr:TetR family transcriptional regulator C-terminal domain-containing protein [Tsukamurella paurometabola]UEA84719.1 TetR family transcriptional regulator C-terminal domain-containing protein [Tsukamurella paurometabola]VDR37299.1 transcriptional regulator BetI [Tsukamurella paurometabola]
MPKIVDPDQRRSAIADAAVTVVARGGADHATLANVAAEAGLAIGSVRHYFDGQAAMVEYAMRWLADRIGDRVRSIAQPVLDGDVTGADARRRATVDLLSELLPLDENRRREVTAWLALSTSAIHRPELRRIVDDLHGAVRALTRAIVERSTAAGGVDPGDRAVVLDAERLAALVDGLAVDAVLCPDLYPPELLRAVIERHLDRAGQADPGRT